MGWNADKYTVITSTLHITREMNCAQWGGVAEKMKLAINLRWWLNGPALHSRTWWWWWWWWWWWLWWLIVPKNLRYTKNSSKAQRAGSAWSIKNNQLGMGKVMRITRVVRSENTFQEASSSYNYNYTRIVTKSGIYSRILPVLTTDTPTKNFGNCHVAKYFF